MSETDFTDRLERRIKAAENKEPVPTNGVRLENNGSSIEVRTRGGFITECKLQTFNTDSKLVNILYCDPDTSIAKLTATHSMSPVGPSESIGGQHGLGRWVDWQIFEPTTSYRGLPMLAMQAKREDMGEALLRTLTLDKYRLNISSTLRSNTDKETKVSLGEHLYFACPEADIPEIKIADYETGEQKSLTETFGPEMVADLLEGKPFFWPGFNGYTEIDLSEETRVIIYSNLSIGPDSTSQHMIHMLIWHRPGTDSICFEPVAGFWKMPDGTMRNDELRLPPYEEVELETSIEVR